MDILFWKNQSKNIKLVHTQKQFYKQYLYKLELNAPGCKSIKEDDISASLDKRLSYARDYNYGGSWMSSKMKTWLNEADVLFLKSLKNLSYQHPNLKFVTQEPKFQIYSENEEDLICFVNNLEINFRSNISLISYPENKESEKLLLQNSIIRKRTPKFNFKIYFREKQFSKSNRINLYNYLIGLGDLVELPKDTISQLQRDHGWMWGAYFYTNDSKIVEFIRLINPDFVREVCPIVKKQDK